MTAAKPRRASARKKVPSKLDPFTEQLLQMDDKQITIQKMAEWLEAQGVETTVANISAFLISRRERREAKQQYDSETNPMAAFQEWLAENPNATLEAVVERFKMLALNLSLKKEAAPEVLKLADQLAQTAIRFINAQSREAYRTRKLLMEEATHAEWIKCEQTRALQLCLTESKKHPEVAGLFRKAFAALKATRTPALRQEVLKYPVPASQVKPATAG